MASASASATISTSLNEAMIVSNGQDTDANKVANKLQDVMEDLGATVFQVTPQDEESVETAMEKVGEVDIISIVATRELLGLSGKDLHSLMKDKTKMKSGVKVLVIKLNMDEDLPEELAKYKIIDYNKVTDFSEKIKQIITGWLNKLDADVNLIFQLKMTIEVHQQKSKKMKDKMKEIKKIRDMIHILLDEIPGNSQSPELRKLLAQNYKVNITSVLVNPLAFEGNLKGEHYWRKLEADCKSQFLSEKMMNIVKKCMGRSNLPFSLKLVLEEISRGKSTKPNRTENVSYIVIDRKTTIIRDLVFNVIEKKEYLPYDFALILNQYKSDLDFVNLHSEKDMYNLLHAIVAFNRLELMIVLVHCKLWRQLMQESVPLNSPTSWRGHTAMQMAEQRKTRKIKDEIIKNETLFNSMGKFLKACHDGDRAAVERQIRQNAEVIHERDSLKNNCLYWTIVNGSLELFEYLVDKKAEFDNVNEENENLLHVACKLGRSQFIKTLLFKCANDVLAVCNAKKTPLERVAENGDLDSLKEFLKYDVQISPSVLPLAAANKRINFVKYLFEESGKTIDVNSQDKDGYTAFTKTCDNGAKDIFQYLLGKGANVNLPDKRRRGPLHYASKSGHLELVKSLILLRSEVNSQDKYTGSEACFLIRGKDKGRYAWHYVEVRRNLVHIFTKKTRSGQVDVAQYGTVIKSGWGQDPEAGIVNWINKMYDDRAERPNAPGDMSALHVAIYREHKEIAAFLIESGADINLKDLFGLTPFMYCALRNDLATATLLANKGANLNERDNEGFTALEIAKMNEHPEMINYIEGINYMDPVQKFLEGAVRACERNLSTRRIEELRQKGEDVKWHAIDELRNLQIEVNCLLLDLGSGPVMKPTEDAETEATMDTAEAAATPNTSSYTYPAFEGPPTMGPPSEESGIDTLPSAVSSMATAYYHPTPSVETALGSAGDIMSTGSTLASGDSQLSTASIRTLVPLVPAAAASASDLPESHEDRQEERLDASAQSSSTKSDAPRKEKSKPKKKKEGEGSIEPSVGSRSGSTKTLTSSSSCSQQSGSGVGEHLPRVEEAQ